LLAKGLESNQHLKALNLSGNSLDDQALEDLTRTVWTCSKLEELDITHNDITDKGLQMIASHVLPSSLRCLGLGFNRLTTRKGASHLLKILQDNAQLSRVRIGTSEQPSSREIEHYLDFNQAGRVLLGQDHSVPLSLWPVVLERANKMFQHSEDDDRERKRANVVFLLLQGPALMQRRSREVFDSATI
jgi:Leucine-rich repeat (LRR) protein